MPRRKGSLRHGRASAAPSAAGAAGTHSSGHCVPGAEHTGPGSSPSPPGALLCSPLAAQPFSRSPLLQEVLQTPPQPWLWLPASWFQGCRCFSRVLLQLQLQRLLPDWQMLVLPPVPSTGVSESHHVPQGREQQLSPLLGQEKTPLFGHRERKDRSVLLLSPTSLCPHRLHSPAGQRLLGHEGQGQLIWVITESRWDSEEWTGGNLTHLELESSRSENKVVPVVPVCASTRSCCCS